MTTTAWILLPGSIAQTAPAKTVDSTLTPGGWFFMLGSIALVISLAAYCYWKVLAKPASANHMHAPLEIDTHDQDT
jgi:hypothetical protein